MKYIVLVTFSLFFIYNFTLPIPCVCFSWSNIALLLCENYNKLFRNDVHVIYNSNVFPYRHTAILR